MVTGSSIMTLCRLSSPAVVCPLGGDHASIAAHLFKGKSGIITQARLVTGDLIPTAAVTASLVSLSEWPYALRTRNNRLLATALEQLKPHLDVLQQRIASPRLAIILGTSTSSIAEGQPALQARMTHGTWPSHDDFHYESFEIGSVSRFARLYLGLDCPEYTLSTACTSSAKALASARRLLASGEYDAVIAGGVDSLCDMTLNGFASLGVTSTSPCLPFSAHRSGINIGEAAALFLCTSEEGGIQLRGYGESSDGYHISTPQPEGIGAEKAMRGALNMASLNAQDIGYLNMHGTGTLHNDAMEAITVHRVFGSQTPVSATKGLTGHTLGASGALEAAFCWLALKKQRVLPHLYDGVPDPELPRLNLVQEDVLHGRYVMSNSFGFGGSNISLVLGRDHDN